MQRRTLILLGVAAAAEAACRRSASPERSGPPVPAAPPRRTIPLAGPWLFRAIAPGSPDAVQDWLPASVPGCVHTDLLAAGKIADPFFGTNEATLQWVGSSDWEYQTSFEVDARARSEQIAELVFEGLDTFATVLLNGVPILEADNMFREWRVAITERLEAGRNTLSVRFRSALREGEAALKRLGYALPATNDLGDPRVSMFTRKAPYHYGWDWGPRLITSGIWRAARLETWSGARLTDVQVFTSSLSDDRAELIVQARVQAHAALPAQLAVALAGARALGSVSADLTPGENVLRLAVHIERPQRWWPNGLGHPHLYTLEVTLAAGSVAGASPPALVPRETRRVRIGLRTLQVVHRADAGGKSFSVWVNGAPVFMKGANYIPQDSFPSRVSAERQARLLESAAAAHMNMLRIWGGGIYEDERFYERCDELGILVWQDFMFACSLYPSDAAFLASVRMEARDVVRRLRNHPCLALWAGNNEMEWALKDWGWEKAFTDAQLAEVHAGYRRLFHELLPEVVAAEDPGRFYTRSSPSANDDAIAANQPGSGDMHYWGVWHVAEPYERYADNVSRFMSEYGFQSFPELATVERFAAPAQQQLDSEVMRAHQRHPRGNELIQEYLQREFRPPRDFESFCYVSQVLQATVIQFAAEAHRRRMPYNWGSLYWQLDDCWPAASWSSIDYFGRWKALHYHAPRFFAPVLASVSAEGELLRVYGVSDRRTPTPARLELRTLDFDGEVLYRRQLAVTLAANASQVYFEAPRAQLLGGRDPRTVLFVAEVHAAGQHSSRSLYFFARSKDLELPDPELELERGSTQEGRTPLRLRARRLARAVWLSAAPAAARDPFAPDGFSDNYFDLLPGEARELEYRGAAPERIALRSLRDSY